MDANLAKDKHNSKQCLWELWILSDVYISSCEFKALRLIFMTSLVFKIIIMFKSSLPFDLLM